jgi:thiamine kinase-like enzyme
MEPAYRIHLQEDLQELLNEIYKVKNHKDIYLHPFNRYGNSGSRLYLIYFSEKENITVPYILKTFEDDDKFMDEKKGMELIENTYPCIQQFTPFKSNGKLSGILLKHANTKPQKANNPITLSDILYKDDEDKICKIIDEAFDDFKLTYLPDKIKIEECNIKEEYYRYLRHDETSGNDRTRGIIEKLVGNIEDEKINFYGKPITNPVYILDNLIKETKMTKSLIHGDLHLNNIVIDDKDNPRIIDFAWSCEKDIYIDFSMFEIAVRYWNSPLLDCETRKVLDDMFLNENIEGYSKNQDAQRIITIVRKIRELSKTYIKGNYDFHHHLLSQFIVLYGLQAYTADFNPFVVIPFLAKLGEKLKYLGYAK